MSIIVWVVVLVLTASPTSIPGTHILQTHTDKATCETEAARIAKDMAASYPDDPSISVECRPRPKTVETDTPKRRGLAVGTTVDPAHLTPEFLKELAKHLSIWLRQHFPDPSKETELHVLHIQDMREAKPAIVIISIQVVKGQELLEACYVFYQHGQIIGWVPAKTSAEPSYEEATTKNLQT